MDGERRRGPWGELHRLVSTIGKYLAYYTTAVKLAQLVPVLIGFAIVLFSPTAWLSATLRTWAFAGMAAGSLLGMAALGILVSRGADRRRHAAWALAVFLGATGLLRLHLATIDIEFVSRWTALRPLQDLYLGSDLGELAFNAITAWWFAVALCSATLGLPLYVKWRGKTSGASSADGEAERVAKVRDAMDLVGEELARLHQMVVDLRDDNVRLTAELAERDREVDRLRADAARTRGRDDERVR